MSTYIIILILVMLLYLVWKVLKEAGNIIGYMDVTSKKTNEFYKDVTDLVKKYKNTGHAELNIKSSHLMTIIVSTAIAQEDMVKKEEQKQKIQLSEAIGHEFESTNLITMNVKYLYLEDLMTEQKTTIDLSLYLTETQLELLEQSNLKEIRKTDDISLRHEFVAPANVKVNIEAVCDAQEVMLNQDNLEMRYLKGITKIQLRSVLSADYVYHEYYFYKTNKNTSALSNKKVLGVVDDSQNGSSSRKNIIPLQCIMNDSYRSLLIFSKKPIESIVRNSIDQGLDFEWQSCDYYNISTDRIENYENMHLSLKSIDETTPELTKSLIFQSRSPYESEEEDQPEMTE